MAMFSGYYDAAGHETDPDALTVSGFLAPVRNWSRFRRDWRKILDAENIDVFHMADFMSCREGFESWRGRRREQAQLLAQLAKVVVRHMHFGVASTVLLADWHDLNREFALKECHVSPYGLAAFSVINKSMKRIKVAFANDILHEFGFESGDCGRGDFMHFMHWVSELSNRELACIHPVFKPKSFEPLQAADFAGWAKRYAVKQALAGTFREFAPHLVAVMRIPHDYGMVDRDRLTEHVELLGVPKRDAWKTLSQKERAKWRPAAFPQGTLYRASERP